MDKDVCGGVRLVDHVLQAEDFVRLRIETGFSITGKFTTIGGVSARGKETFYEKMGFEIISNGMKKMIEIERTI